MFFPIDCSVSSSFFFFLALVLARYGCERRWMGCAAYRQGARLKASHSTLDLAALPSNFFPHMLSKGFASPRPVCVFHVLYVLFFFLSDPLPLNPVVSAFDSPHLFFFCVFHWRAAVSRVAISSSECSADVCLLPMRKKKRCLNIPAPGLHMAYEFISFSIAAHQHSC